MHALANFPGVHHPPCQAEFLQRVVVVKERMEAKEQEISGEWMTEEKMEKCNELSQCLGSAGVLTTETSGTRSSRSRRTVSDFPLHS